MPGTEIPFSQMPARDDPHIASLTPDQQGVLRDLYRKAAAAKPAFDRNVQAIAGAVGGEAKLADLKGTRRAVEKIIADYAGDASRIRDLLRASVVVDTPEQASEVLKLVEELMRVASQGRRDSISGEPGADGYRDIKVNTLEGNQLSGELQIHLRPILEAANPSAPDT